MGMHDILTCTGCPSVLLYRDALVLICTQRRLESCAAPCEPESIVVAAAAAVVVGVVVVVVVDVDHSSLDCICSGRVSIGSIGQRQQQFHV